MRLSVNEKNTIANMGVVFTNHQKVISELIQNARRAGATTIQISAEKDEVTDHLKSIAIYDDGVGINDLSALLSLSQSGWEEGVTASENAFGMGFFSTFFCADTVTVKSNGQSISIDSKAALAMEDIGDFTPDSEAPKSGTIIVLSGLSTTCRHYELYRHVKCMANYSSLPIIFNGEVLSRSMSFDLLAQAHPVIEAPFGKVVIVSPFSMNFRVVLQDLLVYSEEPRSAASNVIYANSTVLARMPDRDCLIDQRGVAEQIRTFLTDHYANELAKLRDTFTDDVKFVNEYFCHIAKFNAKLLNDIDYLPSVAFFGCAYPTQRSDYGTDQNETFCVTSATAAEHLILSSDYYLGEHPVVANFAYFAKAMTLSSRLDAGHWIYPFVVGDLLESDMEVKINGVTEMPFNIDQTGSGLMLVGQEVTLTCKKIGKSVNVIGDGFYIEDVFYTPESQGAEIYLNGELSSITEALVVHQHAKIYDDLLLQISSYVSENDDWLDNDLDRDVDNLQRQFTAAMGGEPASVLKELIGHLPPALIKAMRGKVFTLELNEQDSLSISQAA
jgi:hypothetical protein